MEFHAAGWARRGRALNKRLGKAVRRLRFPCLQRSEGFQNEGYLSIERNGQLDFISTDFVDEFEIWCACEMMHYSTLADAALMREADRRRHFAANRGVRLPLQSGAPTNAITGYSCTARARRFVHRRL